MAVKMRMEPTVGNSKAVSSGKLDVVMADRIRGMFGQTWSACAGDWLELFPKGSCTGSAVQECVADADRFRSYGSKEVQAAWDNLSRTEQDELLDIFFPKKKKYS